MFLFYQFVYLLYLLYNYYYSKAKKSFVNCFYLKINQKERERKNVFENCQKKVEWSKFVLKKN